MTDPTRPSAADVAAFMIARDPHTVHGTLGIRTITAEPGCFVVEVDVDARLHQHAGIVHGGIYVLLAESAASGAAALSVDLTRERVAGQEISASHVRAATAGTLRAAARPIHQGRTSIVYAVEVTNDGALVSVVRCTIAVRPLRA